MATPAIISRPRREAAAARAAVSRARPAATSAALAAADAAALMLAGWAGYFVWSCVNPSLGLEFYFQLAPALAAALAVYASAGLYPGAGLSPVEEMRRIVLGTTAVCLISTAAMFLAKETGAYSRGVFLTSWFFSVALVPAVRALVRRLLARRAWWGVPVLVLGAGRTGRMVVDNLKARPECGLVPVAYLDDDPDKAEQDQGAPVAGPLALAPELARRLKVRQAIVAMPGIGRLELMGVLERLESSFTRLIIVPDMIGMASLWVSPKDLAGVLGLEVRQNLLVPANRWLKRGLDVALALLAGVPALLVIAAAALWIRRASRGPVFYTQEREGRAGARIRVTKLRTMHVDAESLLWKHLAGNAEAREEWQRRFKLRHDPRIIPVIGTLLRRTSLDELPQLWSVLKGEMSLVGPRPLPRYHLDRFDGGFRALRSQAPPGMTGLWQVSARGDGDLGVQEALDSYYIRNWSLWLDLHILARTIRTVLAGKGAY
ncbi:MAG: undecaprenyl-phosphate galactose phosphotransferase WbaP [Bryobacterales bacterium]|nr:undecaprenyl-phosphate galactose phosphotransferase WbaP [Bryobacterales bacterium]